MLLVLSELESGGWIILGIANIILGFIFVYACIKGSDNKNQQNIAGNSRINKDGKAALRMAILRLEELRRYQEMIEKAQTPFILESCRNNMIDNLEWFAKLEKDYPNTSLSDIFVNGANKGIDDVRNYYNERILQFTKEDYEIDYMRGYLDKKASNYHEVLNKFIGMSHKKDHTRVKASEFIDTYSSSIPDWLFEELLKYGKHDYANIPNNVIEKIKATRKQWEEFNNRINQCSELNSKGIKLEKEGRIEDAIRVYEENILYRYPATHSYTRLMVLYRRKKDYKNELRVIRTAIDVFMEENEKRAKLSFESCPEYRDEIQIGLETNETVRDEKGMVIFHPYEVMKLISRMEKVLLLI